MASKNIVSIKAEDIARQSKGSSSKNTVLEHKSEEIIFAVVGHVGSGTSEIAVQLKELLTDKKLGGGPYDVEIIKARKIIFEWSKLNSFELKEKTNKISEVEAYQKAGDEMRRLTADFSIIAKKAILRIRKLRAEKRGIDSTSSQPIEPDGNRRAYIIDSIKHPAEVQLLRHIYKNAFILIGVVCQEDVRLSRIKTKFPTEGEQQAKNFMSEDADSKELHGQKTSAAFHMSDFFLDNTAARMIDVGGEQNENPNWTIVDKLSRLIKIITHSEIVRPEISETAMHHANGAKMRSSCLSRQVGATLVDKQGNILATGTNEVPKAGGGVIGEDFDEINPVNDHRCFFRKGYCSNTRTQNGIIREVMEDLSIFFKNDIDKEEVFTVLRDGKIGDLIEFSRAVHAEMDALLSASRSGSSVVGARLFVTTFPCHYCARHIISSGVDEVQYIEPYPKSEALKLHKDAIETEWNENWNPPSKGGSRVLFRPFSGVAPRLYKRAFLKDRKLKNDITGDMALSDPEWGTPWHLGKLSYVQLEASLLNDE